MRSLSKQRFMPHMGNKVPLGIVMTASTYLKEGELDPALDAGQLPECQIENENKMQYLSFLSLGLTSCVGAS
jgi:hypothetical protein